MAAGVSINGLPPRSGSFCRMTFGVLFRKAPGVRFLYPIGYFLVLVHNECALCRRPVLFDPECQLARFGNESLHIDLGPLAPEFGPRDVNDVVGLGLFSCSSHASAFSITCHLLQSILRLAGPRHEATERIARFLARTPCSRRRHAASSH